jgi:hypothetical protein
MMPTIPDSLKRASFSEKSGNFFTPAMRMMYADLFKPVSPSDEDTAEEKKVWQITGLIPAGYDLSVLEAEIDRIVNEKIKPANDTLRAKLKLPIRETAGIASLASLADEYPYCLRLNAKAYDKHGKRRQAPGVVDASTGAVSEADEADSTYNGRWFRASVNPFNWEHKTGGKGVSFGLVNVQLLSHDDPLAGGKVKASNEFDAIDDAELADLEEEFK